MNGGECMMSVMCAGMEAVSDHRDGIKESQ